VQGQRHGQAEEQLDGKRWAARMGRGVADDVAQRHSMQHVWVLWKDRVLHTHYIPRKPMLVLQGTLLGNESQVLLKRYQSKLIEYCGG